MSTRTPYRRPSPTPEPQRNVITRAESPEEREARETRELAALKQKTNRAQTAQVLAELDAAVLAYSRKMRLIGGGLTALWLALTVNDAYQVAAGADHIWVGRVGNAVFFVGPVLLIVGGGGATGPDSTPSWWRAVVIGTFLVGLGLGASFRVQMVELLAQVFFL